MRCGYFEADDCRSCVRMGEPYAAQLAAKDAAVRELLGAAAATGAGAHALTWDDPCPSPPERFRAKAKMIVGGTPQAPTLGILGPDGAGVDLRGCGILGPYAAAALPVLAAFVTEQGLRPYDVRARTGELKAIHLIEAPAARAVDGGSVSAGSADAALTSGAEAMIRFVLRSEGQVGKIRRGLPDLTAALSRAGLAAPRVVTANLLPEHKAATEGDREIVLTPDADLPMAVGDVRLRLHPGAFLQTNTAVAGELYRQAARWIAEAVPGQRAGAATVLDLYCGVGGFALHAARALGPGAQITGVESSEAAIEGARRAAAAAGLIAAGGAGPEATGRLTASIRFEVGDATTYAEGLRPPPDLVIVNPPRRGIGPHLAAWLDTSGVPAVLYSSCNPATLVADLTAMPSLRPIRGRLFDMFPHTDHAEVLVLLERRRA